MTSIAFGMLFSFLELASVVQQRVHALSGAPVNAPAVRSLDKLPLPPDAVIVIVEGVKNALDRVKPVGVLLSPEEYEELARLRQEAARSRESGVGSRESAAGKGEALFDTCILRGQVVGDSLNLQVELKFKTNAENAVVPVGFKGVKLTNAALDGDTPVWGSYQDGYTLRVKDAKIHQLLLDMRLKVTRADADRSVFLELPRAAITKLDVISIPERAESVLINKTPGAAQVEYPEPEKSLLRSDGLGVLERLELSWQAASPTAVPSAPQVNVVGNLSVDVDERHAETRALLNVETRRGSVGRLRFRLADPAHGRISFLEAVEEQRAPGADATRLGNRRERMKANFDGVGHILTFDFDPPLTSLDKSYPIRVRFQQSLTAKPDSKETAPLWAASERPATLALGVVELLDIAGGVQRGVIAVWKSPGLGVEFRTNALTQTDPAELAEQTQSQRTLAGVFRYARQPVDLNAQVTALQPIVEASASHSLQVSERGLELTSEFQIDVSRAGVRELVVDWPKGMTVKEVLLARQEGPSLVESWRLDETASQVRVMLRPQPVPWKAAIEMKGFQSVQAQSEATPVLPAMRQAVREQSGARAVLVGFRGGELMVRTPDHLDVRLQPGDGGLAWEQDQAPKDEIIRESARLRLESKSPSATANDRPWRFGLSWAQRQYSIDNDLSIYLMPKEWQVRQSLRYDFTAWTPAQVWLRIPPQLDGVLNAQWVSSSGKNTQFAEAALGPVERRPPSSDQEVGQPIAVPAGWKGPCHLILEYRSETPPLEAGSAEGDVVSIPLIRPARARSHGTKARLWATAALRLQPDRDSPWKRTPTMSSSEEEATPQLELRSANWEDALRIRRESASGGLVSEILADRVLLETAGLTDTQWRYRIQYYLSRVRTDHVRVLLPGAGRGMVLEKVLLDREEISRGRLTLTEELNEERTALHIPMEPSRLARPTLLQVTFLLERQADVPFLNVRALAAPELAGAVVIGRVRWRVELPPGRFPLSTGADYIAEQPWQFRGALIAPQPERRADELSEWLSGAGLSEAAYRNLENENERPAFVFTRLGSLGPLRITDGPERLWLLVCSFAVLIPAVILYCFPPRRLFGALVIATVILAMSGVLAPDWLWGLAYGAQPGIAVLAALWLLMWLRQRRWRRQMATLPGFSRLRADSSMATARPSSSVVHLVREPSTVDAPKPAAPLSSEVHVRAAGT